MSRNSAKGMFSIVWLFTACAALSLYAVKAQDVTENQILEQS